MSNKQSPSHDVPKLPPLNKQAQCIVVKEKLPPQIAGMTDCNELRKNLLQLLKDKKQMERQLHLGKEQIQKSAKQLVQETDRPNEQIAARKQHSQFALEKQIQDICAKLESTQPVDVATLQAEIQERYDSQKEFIEFAANTELLDQIIRYQLDLKQKIQTRGALDKQQKVKQPLFQTMLNQVNQDLNRDRERLDILLQQRMDRYTDVGQQHREIQSTFIQKLVEIEARMGIEFAQPHARKAQSVQEQIKEAKAPDMELSMKRPVAENVQTATDNVSEEVKVQIDGEEKEIENQDKKVTESGDFDQTAEFEWGVDK